MISDKDGKCLTVSNGNTDIVTQVWVKPQPQEAMAVFLLSQRDTTDPNATVTINFKELNLTKSTYDVRDIWQHKDLGSATSFFTSDEFGGHDSRFYLLAPSSS